MRSSLASVVVALSFVAACSSSDNAEPNGGPSDASVGDATAAGDGAPADAGVPFPTLPPFAPSVRAGSIGVFRPSTGAWYLNLQRPGWNENAGTQTWGSAKAALPLVGDWDGDGIVTTGLWNPSTQHVSLSNVLGADRPDLDFVFCAAGDTPVAGDWDGDGKATLGCFTSSTARWCLRNSNTAGACDIPSFVFGSPGDLPLVGDWDGDGKTTVGAYHAASFALTNQNQAGAAMISFALGDPTGDVPVVGDWNGDGVSTVGIYRGSTSTWYLRDDFDGGLAEIVTAFGDPQDIPITGNWGSTEPRGGFAPRADVFPLAADFQPSANFASWMGRNANTMIRVPENCSVPGGLCEDATIWSKAAQAAGLREIRGPIGPAAADTDPNLLAFHLLDEPDGQGAGAVPALQVSYAANHASRPAIPNLVNFIGGEILSVGGACAGPGDGVADDCYDQYLHVTDWLSEDVYVATGDLMVMNKALDKLERWAPERPAFPYLQTGPIFAAGTAPSPSQMAAQMWTTITHGARGLFFFAAGDCDNGPCKTADATPSDVAATMTTQNAVLNDLAAVLQTEIDPALVEMSVTRPLVGSKPVWLGATWRVDGDGAAYFIVVNPSPDAVTTTLTVRGVSAPLDVLGEARRVGASGSATFSDTFAPYQVHVYTTGNLALGAKVTSSSSLEAEGWSTTHVVDGRRTTQPSLASLGWTSNATLTSAHDEDLVLDLGAARTVGRVELYPRTDGVNLGYGFPTALAISVSLDGTNWSQVASASSIRLPTTRQGYSFSPVDAQYVKVSGTARANPNEGGAYRVQFAEVEVHAPANKALGATVTTSSSYEMEGWSAAAVTDGLETSFPQALGWSSNGTLTATHDEWVVLDLNAVRSIDRVVLYPRSDGAYGGYGFPTTLRIETSTDGVTWATALNAAALPLPRRTQSYRFAAARARWVKITGGARKSPLGDDYRLQLAEVGIY